MSKTRPNHSLGTPVSLGQMERSRRLV